MKLRLDSTSAMIIVVAILLFGMVSIPLLVKGCRPTNRQLDRAVERSH